MPCYRPIKAYRRGSGEIKFSEAPGDLESLELGCGRCAGCRLNRASSWSVRCQHEAQLFDHNCFVTLTYSDEVNEDPKFKSRRVGEAYLPEHGSLLYADVQRLLKRLRKACRGHQASPSGRYPIRYFAAGEYGGQSWRAHYHLLLFNFDFSDKWRWGESTYRSPLLERLWPLGSSLIGAVTPESCAYVARYSLKKVYGRQASDEFYSWTDETTGEVCKVSPEACAMSRRPGIGAWWYDKYRSDVLPRDYVVVAGRKVKVPRYYSNRYSTSNAVEFEDVQWRRYQKLQAEVPLAERSPERRAVCEEVALARLDSNFGERGF